MGGLKRDSLAGESLDEDLLSSKKSEDKNKMANLLVVLVDHGAAVFELLVSEEESLLI